MIALLYFIVAVLVSPFKSKSRLEAENAALKYQMIVLRRKVGGRIRLTNGDRLFFVQLYRWFPSVLKVIAVVRPETLVRWCYSSRNKYWQCYAHPGNRLSHPIARNSHDGHCQGPLCPQPGCG
jgi:hypothetical protein